MVGVVFFRFGTFYHLDGTPGENDLHWPSGGGGLCCVVTNSKT